MPVSNVIFDGDSSGAVAAAKETQAAIDSVHGKSVDIEVNVRNGGASDAILAAIGEHGNAAADAHDRLSRAEDRASASARDNANAHARATDGMREHSTAAERHMRLVDEMRGGNDRTNDSINESAVSHSRASDALDRHTESAKNFDDMWNRTQGKSFPGFAPPSGPTVQGRAPSLGGESRTPSAPSSEGARIYEMPDRTQQLEAVAAATERLRVAQTRAAASATEFERAFDSAMRSAPEGSNAIEHAQKVTGGLRSEMNSAMGSFSSARNDVRNLERSFENMGTSGLDLTAGLSKLSSVAGPVGQAFMVMGIAGGVSALGMAALAGGTAAIGIGGVVGDIMKSQPLMAQARKGMNDFTEAFHKMTSQSADAGLPGMRALAQNAETIGKTLAGIGVAHMSDTLMGANVLASHLNGTMRALEPAIKPATDAAVSLGASLLDAVGRSEPAIAKFAQTLNAASPGLGQLTEGVISLASTLGGNTVDLLGRLGTPVQRAGGILQGASDLQSSMADSMQSFFTQSDLGRTLSHVLPLPLQALTGTGFFGGDQQSGESARDLPLAYTAKGMPTPLYPLYPGVGGDPNALIGTGQRQGELPKPVSAADSVPTVSQQATPKPSVLTPEQEQQKPLTQLPRSVGESGPGLTGTAQQLATLNQEMAKTTNMSPLMQQSMSSVGQAAQASMMQAGNAAQQGAPQFQQGLNQMQQHAQQLPPQIGSTMSMLGPALQQPMQQAMPQAAQAMQPQPIADAAGAAVTKAVRQVQPAAESSGQDLGASVPEGTSQGITKNVDKVVTIIEHLIKKVIQAGADGLQTASPSRVFDTFGRSIPDGLAQGIEAQAPSAVQATSNLIGQMTTGASGQLGSQQQTLQNQLAQQQQQIQAQQQQAQQAQQQAASIYQQPPGFGGSPFTNQTAAAQEMAKKQEEELKRAIQTGDTSRLSPAQQQQFEQAKQQAGLFQYPDGRMFNQQRHDQLAKLGYGEDTLERIQDREDRHNKIADEKKIERREAHVDALMRGGSEESVKRKLQHEFGEHGKAVGNGTADGIKNSSGQAKSGVADMINGLIDESKKRLAISSPSKVFAGIGGDTVGGLAGGMSSAVAGASATVAGVASDRGLMIGYRWATSMVTGIQSVFKASDFQANAVPQIQNDQAKSVLGQLGLLGPAGSGASIYKTAMVAIGGGASSSSLSNTSIVVQVISTEGRVIDQKIVSSQDRLLSQINDMLSVQVS